jgi:hypothetical protein
MLIHYQLPLKRHVPDRVNAPACRAFTYPNRVVPIRASVVNPSTYQQVTAARREWINPHFISFFNALFV